MHNEPPPLRFTVEEANRAADEWRFNCGPGALCAVLELTPAQVRPHLQGFEAKGYTNPTMMWAALNSLGVRWSKRVLGKKPRHSLQFPDFGLARIQWGGPWCAPGVDVRAAYRHTHWVASIATTPPAIFDVNARTWITLNGWTTVLVPWLLEDCEPRADDEWWLTHAVEIQR